MNIALGADHAGFALKQQIAETLRQAGHTVIDKGTDSATSTDYPDYAGAVGRAVAEGAADRGILVCSTGAGMAIAANKVNGVRAASIVDTDTAKLSREHNDANVIAFGQRLIGIEVAREALKVFLKTPFEGGRHEGRVAKLSREK